MSDSRPAGSSGIRAEVDVIVVTFNSAAWIGRCLDSLVEPGEGPAVNAMVIDNSSSDDTLDVAGRHPLRPTIRSNPSIIGFAAACNQGIRSSSADYILLLNPDAALDPGTLRSMLAYLESNSQVGIVGPRLTDERGELHRDQSSTGIFPGIAQALYEYTRLHRLYPHHAPVRDYFLTPEQRLRDLPVAMVQGACFLFRRALIDRVGMFDERYFLYFEETDFCRRAVNDGWEVHYLGRLAARHEGGHSIKGARQNGEQFIRSFYLYHWKHSGRLKTVALWTVLLVYHGVKSGRMKWLSARNPENKELRRDTDTCATRFRSHLLVLRSG